MFINHMQDKTIKSFNQLSEIKRRDIFTKTGKMKKVNRKYAVSIARQLADGFDKIDLRKEPTKNQYKKAQEIIKEFYNAASSEKTKLVRPRKKNRKVYASYSEMNSKFKVYAVPVFDEKDEIKVVGKGKNKRIKRIGEFSESEFFSFKDAGITKKELIKNTKKSTDKLFSKIERKYKKKTYAVKIKCGKHEYKTLYEDKSPYIEIENWINIYGEDKVKQFCLGFVAYTFRNQEPVATNKLYKKGEKKQKYKNLKNKRRKKK